MLEYFFEFRSYPYISTDETIELPTKLIVVCVCVRVRARARVCVCGGGGVVVVVVAFFPLLKQYRHLYEYDDEFEAFPTYPVVLGFKGWCQTMDLRLDLS